VRKDTRTVTGEPVTGERPAAGPRRRGTEPELEHSRLPSAAALQERMMPLADQLDSRKDSACRDLAHQVRAIRADLNNRTERFHQPTRQRERAMKKFTSLGGGGCAAIPVLEAVEFGSRR
jgi:hypothetical protein